MSDSVLRQRNRGCYSNPFSGVGMEFFPLGTIPDQSGVVLHEVGYLARNDWWNFPNTLSPFWRLYYNGRPGHKVVFPHAEYPLTPEYIVLIPDQQLFHSVGTGPVPHTWMTFQVAKRLDAQQPIPIRLRPRPVERQLLRELARQFTGIGEGNRERALHLGLALLHVVLIRSELRWQTEPPGPGLLRAVRHIETHYPQPLRVEQLARIAGMTERRFRRAFEAARGVSPHRFLMQVRVREAANLLVNSRASLEEIAERTGFPNRHYLTRVFIKITGETPGRFRRQHGESQDSNQSVPK